MDKKKKLLIFSGLLVVCLTLIGSFSYAVMTKSLSGERKYSLNIGELNFTIDNEANAISLGSMYPTTDAKGKALTPFTFKLNNKDSSPVSYTIKLVGDSSNTLSTSKVKYYLTQGSNIKGPVLLSTGTTIYEGVINGKETLDFSLRLWLEINATVDEEGKVFNGHIEVSANQVINEVYADNSGASYPELQGDLVPVVISDTGSVTKANLTQKWYDYDDAMWANAVILNEGYGPYSDGTTIPEEAIEAYFVWIPRFRYKIFDEGNYTSLTTKEQAEQPIEIAFEDKTFKESTGTTVGTWLTHPAFTSFDSNGMWVGKFESGYRGATSTSGAEQDSSDYTKLVIKPNVYSWRYIKVGNAFKVSYDYHRDLDSHMMKNTEWGAVAYLSHSKYGRVGSVRTNNNSEYITGYSALNEPTIGYSVSSIEGNRYEETSLGVDGTYTVNYLNVNSVISSTTGNYSGIYDMSGGAQEYVMGYSTQASSIGGGSTITSLYSNFYANDIYNKYYDKYISTAVVDYNLRLLGDATGEMGPFYSQVETNSATRNKSSWYVDYAHFVTSSSPWFYRGGQYSNGISNGTFSFRGATGGQFSDISFRVVLTPQSN